MSSLDELISLQELDAALDQIPHRRRRLPERATAEEAAALVAQLEAARTAALERAAVAISRIEELEAANTTRSTKKARLEQQLKTVIAPREAEALMHEIARLDAERSEADDEELALLDEVEGADAAVAATDAALIERREIESTAMVALAEAESVLDAEATELARRRADAQSPIAPDLLARYDSMRSSFGGTAIARVTGGHCGACHLDLSRAFLDRLKNAPPDTIVECEQCGRLLVA